MQRNPQYEAGFIRAVDHADPEDLVMEEERRARSRKLAVTGAAVLVACIAVGAFVATRGESPETHLARGKELIAGNAHQAAIVELKRSLLADANQPAVRFLLGQEYALLGDPKAAEIEFRKALEMKHDPERTLPLLVASIAQQGSVEKVVTTVKAATVDSPAANADLQALLGSAYFALGKEAEANAAWKAATDFVPAHPGALLAEAKALAARGAYDEASALLARVPSTTPRRNEWEALRGDIARDTGKPGDAATAYEAAVALDAGNLPLRASLAQTYVDLGRFDDAQRQVDAIFRASPNHPKAQFIAAEAAFGRKDLRAAREAITQSIQQQPRNGRAHLLAGTIAAGMALPEEAELHLREAVALLPKDGDARRTLADFYVARRDPVRADEAIGPLVATAPDDPRVAGLVARIALLQGDALRASKAYDAIDPARPGTVDASLRSASLKLAAGDSAGAFARLRAAGRAHPDDIGIDAAMVAGFLQLRQAKEANGAWNAMVAKRPDAARTYEVRSKIDLATGDRGAARRALEKAVALDANDLAAVAGLAQLDVDERKIDDAKDRLRSYIATHPAQVDATLQLVAIEKTGEGRDDAILALLREARRHDPRAPRVVQALAAHELAHGDARQALLTADEGLAIAPADASLLVVAGDAAFASGNAVRATAIFKTLTAMDVESVDYPTRLGAARLATGDPEAALAAFRVALARKPDRVDLHRTLVARLLAAGKADEASRLLYEVERLSPKSPALPELDADVKLARRQYPDAIAAYRRALELTPTPELAIRSFEALTKARQSGEANALLASWLKAHPNDEAVRRFDAEVALRTGDYGRASDDFRALLRLRPNDADLMRRLASSDARERGAQVADAPPGAVRNASMQTRPGS